MTATRSRTVAALAEKYQAAGFSEATRERVRDWVHLAREYGWLTKEPDRRGLGSGSATPKLKRWLQRQGGAKR